MSPPTPPALLAINPATADVVIREVTGLEPGTLKEGERIGLIVNVNREDVFGPRPLVLSGDHECSSWMTYLALICISGGLGYGLSRLSGWLCGRKNNDLPSGKIVQNA